MCVVSSFIAGSGRATLFFLIGAIVFVVPSPLEEAKGSNKRPAAASNLDSSSVPAKKATGTMCSLYYEQRAPLQ